METLESISARLETTEDIQSIVRTMKSLSAVSIHQYERAVEALRNYQRAVDLGFQAILRTGEIPRDWGTAAPFPDALIVIGSDQGLCGNFNETVTRFARENFLVRPGNDRPRTLLLAAGLRGAARLEAMGHPPDALFQLPGSVNGLVATAQTILVQIDRWRDDPGLREVHICFNRRTEASRASAGGARLVPLSREYLWELKHSEWPSRRLPTYSMERDALLSWLIRQKLFLQLYRGIAESLASEHAQRLAAMQAAETNIEERKVDLRGEYRQKRQESITTELLDIVSGFESLKEPDEEE